MPKQPLICKKCEIPMNHHADKEDQSTGEILEVHSCPGCGAIGTRKEE